MVVFPQVPESNKLISSIEFPARWYRRAPFRIKIKQQHQQVNLLPQARFVFTGRAHNWTGKIGNWELIKSVFPTCGPHPLLCEGRQHRPSAMTNVPCWPPRETRSEHVPSLSLRRWKWARSTGRKRLFAQSCWKVRLNLMAHNCQTAFLFTGFLIYFNIDFG